MTAMDWYLPVIWAGLIGTAVVLYVILDGFDLGIGILYPRASERERDQMMNTVAPFWDGNETWLVLGGGGLWVAFPRAYAVIMPALYLPVIAMLLALVLRGVAFEFRWVASDRSRPRWSFAFWGGSVIAAFAQGVILGGLIQGITVQNGRFAGGTFDWLTPFSVVVGIAVVCGYALLGATWLVMKTDGSTQARARALARPLLLAVLLFMGVVSLWTPLAIERISERWFDWPNIAYLWPVPLLTAALAFFTWRQLEEHHDVWPFFGAIGLFLLGYLGIAVSNFPHLVPPSLTVWDTAAAPASQIFMLMGTLVLLPMILGYMVFIYWTFRGKVREGEGYH